MKTDITGSTSSQFSNFYSHKAISGVPHYASSFLSNRPPKPGTTPAYFKLKETKQQKYLVKDTSFFRLFSRIKSRLKMNSHYIWKLLLDGVCDKERLPGTAQLLHSHREAVPALLFSNQFYKFPLWQLFPVLISELILKGSFMACINRT